MSGNLFYSVEVSPTVQDLALGYIDTVKHIVPRATWTPREKLHITVGFLGRDTTRAIMECSMALHELDVKAFHLNIKGLGVFGGRVLYAKIVEGGQWLTVIANQLAGTVNYTPHLTLAKLEKRGDKEPLFYELAAEQPPQHFGSCKVDRVKLIQTTPTGYVCLSSRELV
jgi:2'-5' RNA ligase